MLKNKELKNKELKCEECKELIGYVKKKWIIIFILNKQYLCGKCWNKKTSRGD